MNWDKIFIIWRIHERLKEWKDERMKEWKDKKIKGCNDERMKVCNEWVNECYLKMGQHEQLE